MVGRNPFQDGSAEWWFDRQNDDRKCDCPFAEQVGSQDGQAPFHLPESDGGQTAQTPTSICWSPTNRGRSSSVPPNSSRQSSNTSLRLVCSSSREAPCVCAPGMPGTIPTYSLVSGSHSTYAEKVLKGHLVCLYSRVSSSLRAHSVLPAFHIGPLGDGSL
jgi:hypothetical protein